MNIFTKLTGAAMIAGCALTVNAQGLGKAAMVDPTPNFPQTYLLSVTLGYSLDNQSLELITLADTDLNVLLTMPNGKTYEINSYDIYYDPYLITNGTYTSADQGNELIIPFNVEASEAGYPVGVYTLDIPEGIVKNGQGLTNAEQTLTFRKADPVDPVSVTPETNEMHSSLNTVTVTFDESIAINPAAELIELTLLDKFEATPYYIEKDRYSIGADGKSLVLDIEGLLNRGEWYYLMIPESFVSVGENYVNSRIWLEYMLWDGMPQAEIISAPIPNSSQADLNPFILKYDQPIHIPADAPDTEFVIGFPDYGIKDGDRVWIPADWYELVYIDADGNAMAPTEALPANGVFLDVSLLTEDWPSYRFVINFPIGLVVGEDGLENPPLKYTFNVWNIWPNPTITADAGTISITWPNSNWVTYALSDDEVTLRDDETGETRILLFNFGGSTAGEVGISNDTPTPTVNIDLNGLDLANGTYTLNVPQGYVYLKGVYGENIMNAEVNYTFSWTNGGFGGSNGVEFTTTETDGCVYDLQGRRVARSSDLSRLGKGIYILNGNKILVKE